MKLFLISINSPVKPLTKKDYMFKYYFIRFEINKKSPSKSNGINLSKYNVTQKLKKLFRS